jgi:hypothetical protein
MAKEFKGVGFRIDDIYAFLAVDRTDGDEGIMGFGNPAVPMIAADLTRLQQLRPLAEQLAKAGDLRVKLVRFTTRTEIDEFGP